MPTNLEKTGRDDILGALVTVIIPVYNVEQYLVKCIDSVCGQTYKDLEIILVDDGSSDRCPQICDEYTDKDNRIHVIHKENGGQGSARNRALDICHGEYIAFLDSDDYWDENYVASLMKEFTDSELDIVVCNYHCVTPEGKRLKSPHSAIRKKNYTNIEALQTILYWNEFGVAPWAKIYRATVWSNVRFKEDRIYEDLATTYLVYYAARKVRFINQPLMYYVIRPNSDIHRPFNPKKIRILDTADEILSFAERHCPQIVKAAQSRILVSSCFVCFRMSKQDIKDYRPTVQRCWSSIKKYRFEVMLDKRARLKTRVGALCSYLGFQCEWTIFRVLFSLNIIF